MLSPTFNRMTSSVDLFFLTMQSIIKFAFDRSQTISQVHQILPSDLCIWNLYHGIFDPFPHKCSDILNLESQQECRTSSVKDERLSFVVVVSTQPELILILNNWISFRITSSSEVAL